MSVCSKPESKDGAEVIIVPPTSDPYQGEYMAWDAPLLTARENALHPDDYK